MKVNIQGMLMYSQRKSIDKIIIANNGYELSHQEALRYLEYLDKQGYTDLYKSPDYFEVIDKLTDKL